MFVPAPTLRTNGTVKRTGVHTWYMSNLYSLSMRELAWTNRREASGSTNQMLFGQRTRGLMTSGKRPSGGFNDTPYKSLAFMARPYGTVTYERWNNYLKTKVRTITLDGLGFGYTGGNDSGVGTNQLTVFDWDYSSLELAKLANNSAIGNLSRRVETGVRIKASRQIMDLSEALVDLDQSISMVASAARSLAGFVSELRRRNYRRALEYVGITTNPSKQLTPESVWLQYHYGWKPLVTDILDGARAFNKGFSDPTGTLTCVRRGRVTLMPSASQLPPGAYVARCDAHGLAECKVRYRISDPAKHHMASLMLNNPLYFAWVGMRLSFVVDWLVDVSSFLQSATSIHGLDFAGGYTTLKSEARLWVETKGPDDDPALRAEGLAGVELRQVKMTRKRHTTWPQPRLYYRFPFTSATRVGSALALIATLTK